MKVDMKLKWHKDSIPEEISQDQAFEAYIGIA